MKTIKLNLTLTDFMQILKVLSKISSGFYVKCNNFYFPALLTSKNKINLSKWDELNMKEMEKCDELVLIKKPFNSTVQIDVTNNLGYTYYYNKNKEV